MVRLIAGTLLAVTVMAAADVSLEIGSPAAAISPGADGRKVKNAAFSIRARECPDAQFSGIAHWTSGMKQSTEPLIFTGSAGVYSVARSNPQAFGPWVAVITADCAGTKLGALVPVSASGAYDRAAAKFVPHAPTPLEMETMLRQTIGGTR